MNSLIILNEADESRLHTILHHTSKPFPDAGKEAVIRQIIHTARIGKTEAALNHRVGFYDLVTLVSPIDSLDFFKFHIVMPHESDIDHDRISVCTPIAAATLGRATGDLIQWLTPAGPRQMRLIAIRKSDSSALAHEETLSASFLS